MDMQSVSTKELRDQLPRIREGLIRGERYMLIYRSKIIARLEPVEQTVLANNKVQGGRLRLQANTSHLLTPKYLKKLAMEKYE
ncbi:MAG: hypothetical protein ACYDAS_01485 [Patescibacteria group bacterium]